MLVLTRRPGQAIKIGDDVQITVIDVRAGQVRLGVSAPPNVSVHRKEVRQEIQAQNRAAARGDLADVPLLPVNRATR